MKQVLESDLEASDRFIGKPIKIKEDLIAIRGKGTYVDDYEIPGTLYLSYATSTYGHAKIKHIDVSRAKKLEGVVDIITGVELEKNLAPFMQIAQPPSGDLKDYPLAVGKVRYYGEPVVAVVATDPYVAEDAAELIEITYEPLPVVLDGEKSLEKGAPLVHENIGSNLVWRGVWDLGNVDEAFKKADVIVEDTVKNHRYASVPLETSAVLALYNETHDVIEVYSVNQMPMFSLPLICGSLKIPPSKFRMIVPPNVGGAFGGKIINYTHITLLSYIARKIRRPVKYVETRTENIMFGTHNNERTYHVSIAVKKDGKVVGVKMKAIDNCGAYTRYEPAGAVIWSQVTPGIYDIPDIYVEFLQVLSNKGPTGPVRGYSRLQHNFMWERMMDIVSRKLNLDPTDVRRKNLIRKDQMPYVGPSGTIYDGGDYFKSFDMLMEKLEYKKWRGVQLEERKKGRLIGVGFSAVIDSGANNFSQIKIINPYFPVSGNSETGMVMINQFGEIVCRSGTTDQGQSHATTFAQIVAEVLSTDPQNITYQTGFDSISNIWAAHSGAYASRSAVLAGTALFMAAGELRNKLKIIAAHLLNERESDLVVENSEVKSSVSGKKISFGEIASVAWSDVMRLPKDVQPGLMSYYVYSPDFTKNMPDKSNRINNTLTYSYSMHGTVVEVDPETFQVNILKHVVVSDPGRMINPLVVEGQENGATMHGMSAALLEELVYDDDGMLMSSNFWDYNVMDAKKMPHIDAINNVTHSTSSLTGVRGIGEGGGGPIGSIVNATEDAVYHLGIRLNKSHISPSEMYEKRKEVKK